MNAQKPNVLQRYASTRWDIPAFARLLGVELHPGQVRFANELIKRDQTRWRALWLTLALSSGNRAGKTMVLAICVLHHTMHKMGLRPPDINNKREMDTWLRAPYHWYHFGIQQEVAELVYFEMTALLEGRHPAQKGKGCPLVDELGGSQVAKFDVKERGEYRWVQVHAIFGGGEIHFRTTNEKALGSLGKDMNGISFDECGFEQNLTFVVNEVFHLRRLATGGPLLLISTPSEGFTQFSDEWLRGDPMNPDREPDRISLRMSTRDNIGFGIDSNIFDRLVAGMPPSLVPQNIDGYFIEGRRAFFNHEAVDRAFDPHLHDERASKGNHYVGGIDPALTHDGTWAIILRQDGDRGTGVHAARRKGKQTMPHVVGLAEDAHLSYNGDGFDCTTGLDTSGFGGKVFREALGHLSGIRNVEFGGVRSRKMRMLTDLKGLLEKGYLRFPREGVWLELRRQLLGYRLNEAGSDKGQETDAVMALCIAVKMLLSTPAGSTESTPFEFFGQVPYDEVEEGYEDVAVGNTEIDRVFALRKGETSRMLA